MRLSSVRLWFSFAVALVLCSSGAFAQFTFQHIGGGATGSIVTNDPATGSYTFDGGGNDIWSCSDEFDFAHYTVSGDFDVNVRLESVEPVARWTKAGLMVREQMVSLARMAFIRGTPPDVPTGNGGNGVNDVRFSYRTGLTACNQGEHEDGNARPNFPNCWIRLVRTNTTVVGLYSSDGNNWSVQGIQDTATWEGGALPATIELGFAVSRHSSSDPLATVQYRDFAPSTVARILSQPANQLVSIGQSAVFTVGIGSGFEGILSYQWMRNGAVIPGATAQSYTKTDAALADSGATFSVLVSNRVSHVTELSSNAVLTVTPSPQISSVSTKGDPNGIYVTFSRVMDPATTLNAANYTVSSGVTVSGVTFWGQNTNAVRLDVSTLTLGSSYTVSVTGIRDSDGNGIVPDPATANVTHGVNISPAYSLVFRRYDGVSGATISALRSNGSFPCSPSRVNNTIPTMEYSTDPSQINSSDGWVDNYGSWMYGMFAPTVSGNYQFGVSSDDASELYLSSDASPANKALLASQTGWNDFHNYSGRTATRYLEAGRLYYMEVFHADGCCGDHVTVAVSPPGSPAIANGQGPVSASSFAAAYSYGCPPQSFFTHLGPIAISRQPVNATAIEDTSTSFSVDVDGSGPHAFQWFKNGVAISGATKSTLTRVATLADGGSTFYVVANNDFSSITSSVVTLSVTPAPHLADVSSRGDTTGVYVRYTKPMNSTALDISNYSINNGVTISGAAFFGANNDTVRLQVSTLANGSYNLSVQNVQDSAGNVLSPSPSSANFSSFNGTFTANFSSMPSGGSVYGSASVINGVLMLTTNQNSLVGSFVLNDFLSGAAFQGFQASWKATIGFGSSPVADGYSFCVATDLPSGTWNEEGAGSGLIISFDTFDNGGGEAPSIEVRVGSTVLSHLSYQVSNNQSNTPVSVTLLSDGRLNLVYNDVVLVTNLQTGFRPAPGTKWGFAGRTGGYNQFNVVDDLVIKVFNPGAVTLLAQPADQTVNELDTVSWSAPVDGSMPYRYQWYRNGTAIPGATNAVYTFTAMRTDNAQFSASISNGFSGVTTTNWTLHVNYDTTPPVFAGARAHHSRHHVVLTYSEAVDSASGTNLGSYTITNSVGAPLAIVAARLVSPSNVVLTTDLQAEGDTYTIVVNGVTDRAGVPNPIAANTARTFRGFVFTPGFSLMEVYNTGSGGAVQLLRNASSYPWLPRESYYIHEVNTRDAYPNDSHETYGARLSGVLVPPTNGNYVLYISADDDAEFLYSTNDNPAFLTSQVTSPSCCQPFSAHPTPALPLAAQSRYAYELLYKEGTGGDYAALALDGNAATPGQNMTNIAGILTGPWIGVYADPNNTTIVLTQAPQNRISVPNQVVAFGIGATNSAGLPQVYAWQRFDPVAGVFTNIPGAFGATNRTLLFGPLSLQDDGAQFRAIAYAPGASAAATFSLTVTNDTLPPTVIAASANATFRQVLVTYSEPMDTNASAGLLEPMNYILEDGSGFYCFSVVQQLSPTNVLLTLDSSSCDPELLENTAYTISVWPNSVQDANGNPIQATGNSAPFRSWVRSRGFAKYEFYKNITGTTIALLTSASTYPNQPTVSYYTNTLEWPQSVPDMSDYGLRMSGLFVPPVSGNYTFYVKNDDDAQFSLSTDENPANLVLVRSIGCCNGSYAGAATVNGLIAGKGYYFEALLKEGGGGDYLVVGVQAPGASSPSPIGASYLMLPLPGTGAPQIAIAQNPASHTVEQNHTATFSVLATNAGVSGATYVWQVNQGAGWADLGAFGASYTTPRTTLAMDGWQYRAKAFAPGAVAISAPATLNVTADTNPAVAFLAHGVYSNNAVTVLFDDLVEPASAQTLANYTLTDSNGTPLLITGAALSQDNMSVTLLLDPSTPTVYSATYHLAVSNLVDQVASPVAGAVLPFQTWTLSRGAAVFEAYLNTGGGTAVSVLTGHADYPNNPQVRRHVAGMDSRPAFPDDSHNDYGARISGYFVPPVSGNYILYVKSDDASQLWLSTDANPANKVLVTEEPGCCNGFSAHASAQKTLVAGQSYYVDLLYKEGGGGDFGQAAAKLVSDPTAPDSLAPLSGAFLWSLADPMGTSITVTQQPQSVTVTQFFAATFSAGGAGSTLYGDGDVVYQWQTSGDGGATWSDIPGEIKQSYTTPELNVADSGRQYRALLIVPGGSKPTAAATVTVAADVIPPAIVSATRLANPSLIRVVFSERMGASAGNPANYSINGVTVSQASVLGATVTLTTASPLADTGNYILSVNNAQDLAGNAIAPNSSRAIYIIHPRAPVSGTLVVEAEDYDSIDELNGHTWTFSNAAFGNGSFSGAGYMMATPNSDTGTVNNGDSTNGPRLNYIVNFPSAGTWYVWLRGNASSGSDNSCHIGLDGTMDANGYSIGNGGPPPGWGDNTWHWVRDRNGSEAPPASVTVPSAGVHTFTIWMREDGLRVDKVLLTTDSALTFSDRTVLGSAATPQVTFVPPPVVGSALSGTNLTIQWTAPGVLQSADQVTGPWTNVPSATSPVIVDPATASQKYFRVIR